MPKPWTDAENDLVVADYFAMLAKDSAGDALNKAEHLRNLIPRLQDRTKSSVQFKHQNISAILDSLGKEWLKGYAPLSNVQNALVDAVKRWQRKNPEWMSRNSAVHPIGGRQKLKMQAIESPPLLGDQGPLQNSKLEWRQHIVRKFNVAQFDKRNRDLGRAGEECVLEHERAVLTNSGRKDLARKVRWVSEEDGDGAGYDIASFKPDGRERLLEVKTTNNGWKCTPFYITRNELRVAEERSAEWRLFRLWNFSRGPKAFELRPPLEGHVRLTGMTFQASFS